MANLKHVLPGLLEDASYRNSRAYSLRDQRVIAMKLTSGAPCSSHSELFAAWPGPEQGIEKWFILENGAAVGIFGEKAEQRGFPVVEFGSDP